MNFKDYMNSWTGAQSEVRVQRIANIALVFLCIVLALGWMGRHEVVVEVPPKLSKDAWVTNNAASDEIFEQWGLSIAELLGNVTPASAGFLKESIAPMLTPKLYQPMLDAIDAQVKQIKTEQVTVRFSPTQVKRDQRNGHVIVAGELTTTGVQGTAQHEQRTYDMNLVVMNYRVLLDEIETYKGDPKIAQ